MKQLDEVTSNKILALKDLMRHNLEQIKDLKIQMSNKVNKGKNSNNDES